MTIGANSYGTVAEVAALTKRYTVSGSYTTGSNPTLAEVEAMVDRISGLLNVLLAKEGFAVPVTQADCKLALADFVVGQTAMLVHGSQGHGIYAPGSERLRSTTPQRAILKEAQDFIEANASGFEQLGATRNRHATDGLACWDTDDAGNAIEPIFQRGMIGNSIVDWDTDS